MTNSNGELALTQIQSRILIAFLRSRKDYLNTESLLKQVGIALSTWSEEQNRLIAFGLLEKIPARIMSSNKIVRVMNYRLSNKGRTVALNLFNISRILAQAPVNNVEEIENASYSGQSEVLRKIESDPEQKIRDCIEAGLDSFGMNFVQLVKTNLEIESGIKWLDVARNPESLLLTLSNLFGSDGSRAIELMISANIRSQFGSRAARSENLSILVHSVLALEPSREFEKTGITN